MGTSAGGTSAGGYKCRWVQVWYSGRVQLYGTVVGYSGRERTGTCMDDRSYQTSVSKTSRLVGCLTPVGITDEVVYRSWEGCSCSASCVSNADGC